LIHIRAKSSAERNDPSYSKYILLNRYHPQSTTTPVLGELKGIFKTIESHANLMIIRLESDDTLEVKVCSYSIMLFLYVCILLYILYSYQWMDHQ